MQFKGKEITEEMLEKASKCNSADELIKLAAENGIEITAEEAEAYLDEETDLELDAVTLDQAAGGEKCWTYNPCWGYA